jgi:hypothetical protein
MPIAFRPAVRDNTSLLISIAGASGSGKTYSALKIARGLCGGDDSKIAVIDTEAGRALHYAPAPGEKPGPDKFGFQHADMTAPFSPESYLEAIKTADAQGFEVIVIDSGSHVWEGEGGVHEIHAVLLQKAVEKARKYHSGNYEFDEDKAKERVQVTIWDEAKEGHKKFVAKLLQLRAHVILCLRADEKIRIIKDEKGRTRIIQAADLPPQERWSPICEKRLPYDITLSIILTPQNPGVPIPIKLQKQHRAAVPLKQPLSERTGEMLAAWAKGSATAAQSVPAPADGAQSPYATEAELLDASRVAAMGGLESYQQFWKSIPEQDRSWLRVQPIGGENYHDANKAAAAKSDEQIVERDAQ